MKRKTHKIIDKISDILLFVGTEKQCQKFFEESKISFKLLMVPLSKESFKHKLINENGKIIELNTEFNLYHGLDLLFNDAKINYKVIKLSKEESEHYQKLNPPQIKMEIKYKYT
jgi:hypothetical protein